MTNEALDRQIQNISFGALFGMLYVWPLRTDEKREAHELRLKYIELWFSSGLPDEWQTRYSNQVLLSGIQ